MAPRGARVIAAAGGELKASLKVAAEKPSLLLPLPPARCCPRSLLHRCRWLLHPALPAC
jgi:hypothetical protein